MPRYGAPMAGSGAENGHERGGASPLTRSAPAGDPDAGASDVLYGVAGGVATITIHRPAALNAYTTETLEHLASKIRQATEDDAVGVIVLTGSGTRAFCTGGDVKEYAQRYTRRPREYWQYMGRFQDVVQGLLECGKPTIARLNGITVGGGNELHLACDLSVAASHIYIGQVGVGVGSVAAGGATQWLPLAVGDRRARRMLLLNDRIPARQALDWGLVSEVVPSVRANGSFVSDPSAEAVRNAERNTAGYSMDLTALDAAVAELSGRMLQMFPECLRYTKQQVNFWKELAWHSTIGHARDWLTLHFATREPHEGMNAFVEKRPPAVGGLRAERARGEAAEYFHGAPVAACPKCGATNIPEGFRFCGVCGASLGSSAGTGP